MTEPITLENIIPEFYMIPGTDPPVYNFKNIITNPSPFVTIIKGLKSSRRVEVIENILGMFEKWMHNRIIVNNPMNMDKYGVDLVKLWISAYLSDYAKTDQSTRDVLLKLVKEITIGGRYQKHHFEMIYSYIARNPEDLYSSLKLIENMIWVDKNHIPMFYFSDHDSYIEINPLLVSEKAFANGFAISIWLRIEFANSHLMSGEYPTLFSIYSDNHGGFEAYFDNNVLYYKTLNSKGYVHGHEDSKSIEVYEFEVEKWTNFSMVTTSSDTKFILNGEIIKEEKIAYPKMEVGKLDRGFICKNFTGQVSSILVFGDKIKAKNLQELYYKFPKEVNPELFTDVLENHPKFKEDKLKQKLFSAFFPSRAQKYSKSPDIYIEYNNTTNKGKLGPLSGVFWQDKQKNQFLFWGELKALLPIMPLFRNITDVKLGQKTFKKFLDIICTFTDLLTQENIKEFTMEDFFGGFFQFFYWIPLSFFTKKTIESLIEIRFKLLEDSTFFVNLMYTTDIWINLDFEIQNFYWDYIKEIYCQDPKHYLDWFDIKSLIYIIKHISTRL